LIIFVHGNGNVLLCENSCGCPAWLSAKHHPELAVGGGWAASPAPMCYPNNTWGRPGRVGPLCQTRMGGPLPSGSGWQWPGRWAGLATATLPNTLLPPRSFETRDITHSIFTSIANII